MRSRVEPEREREALENERRDAEAAARQKMLWRL